MTSDRRTDGSDASAGGVRGAGAAETRFPGAGSLADARQLLAHDIRAAVSDVIGGLRLLDRDRLPQEATRQIDRVHAASELLARLVEDLLDDAPRDSMAAVGNLNLRRFLDDELRRWHGAAQGTGTRVTLDRAADLPEIVRLDLLHLRRIVANLMGNALRHGGDGRLVLGAELSADRTLSLRVTDDGPGFPEALLPNVFEPGAGLGGDRAGMGLHIAAAHAVAMGGTLRAENRETGGARVTLTFPHSIWRRPATSSTGEMPDLSGRRVLVADDSATNRTLLRGMLVQLGAECELARDGIEALNWMARERFDLALVDIEMPVLNGLEVLRAERLRQARGMALPMAMVAMTAYVLRDNSEAIMEAGADAILGKPLPPIGTFARLIDGLLDAAPALKDWPPEDAPALSAITLSDLLAAAGPAYQGQLLMRLREDLEMVERHLAEALADGDVVAAGAQSHVLLSLASNVGALPTLETARRLSRAASEGDLAAVRTEGALCLEKLAELRRELAVTSAG